MISSLKDLYVKELQDLYSAEKQVLEALPKMEEAASGAHIKAAFRKHADQTQRQIERLDRIFRALDESPNGEKCKGMEGLIKEGESMIAEKPPADILDAALISAAQRVEHYEMAGYGTCRAWAKQLDRMDDAKLLQETLDEEGHTDQRLTFLAEYRTNPEAMKQAAA